MPHELFSRAFRGPCLFILLWSSAAISTTRSACLCGACAANGQASASVAFMLFSDGIACGVSAQRTPVQAGHLLQSPLCSFRTGSSRGASACTVRGPSCICAHNPVLRGRVHGGLLFEAGAHRFPWGGTRQTRCNMQDSMNSGASSVGRTIMNGEFVLRRGLLSDLQPLTDLSVQAFEPEFMERLADAMQSALGLSNYRSSVEQGLVKRLSRVGGRGQAGRARCGVLDVDKSGPAAHDVTEICGTRRGSVAGDGEGQKEEEGETVERGQKRAQEEGEGYELLVAESCRDGRIAGMVELGVLPCPIPIERRPAPELPYLVNLAVDPRYRRRGLGQELVAACEKVAKDEWGYSEIFLYVKRQNTAAVCLYYSMGYVCEWQEPVWYKLKSGGQRMQRNPKMFLRKDQI